MDQKDGVLVTFVGAGCGTSMSMGSSSEERRASCFPKVAMFSDLKSIKEDYCSSMFAPIVIYRKGFSNFLTLTVSSSDYYCQYGYFPHYKEHYSFHEYQGLLLLQFLFAPMKIFSQV